MSLEIFVNQFANQFDDTDPSEITAQTEFRKLEEWSSIMVLTIISMMDTEYGVIMSAEDLRQCQSVADVYNKLLDLESAG